MKKQLLGMAVGLALVSAGLLAQTGGVYGSGVGSGLGSYGTAMPAQFQQAGTMGTVSVRGGVIGTVGNAGPLAVIGRPVSATEERKSVQTLGDGTEISTSDSNLFYRDSQGRVRVEQIWEGRTVIAILDPVARYFVEALDPVAKTAARMAIPAGVNVGGLSISGGIVYRGFAPQVLEITATTPSGGVSGRWTTYVATAGGIATSTSTASTGRGGRGGANNTVNEDLGVQSQNGVLAVGTRSTLTIPQGQIGNSRDIQVVNERWFSEDLQMLVKSVNADPRFGENTYQLTNVSRSEPDPALFQIPPGYTITDSPSPAGRGGRGGLTAPAPVIK
jgi:hypothetical protein